MERKLAAILAADVVGYSKMMAEDEAGTMAALRAHRREVFDPALAKHGGRLVKLMGDGSLVEFPSVVAAVTAANDLSAKVWVVDEAGMTLQTRPVTVGEMRGSLIEIADGLERRDDDRQPDRERAN